MPRGTWTKKRERQYEHVKESLLDRGETGDISSSRRGGLRSHSGAKGRTYDQLYAEAKRQHVEGRSKMNKQELKRAVDG